MTQPVRSIRRVGPGAFEAEAQVAVAIVGGGACGLTAALMLADAGVDCVVLERDALPSGSTALSSGFIPAPGTRVQRAHGVADDSAARFAADIQAKAHGRARPRWSRRMPAPSAPRSTPCRRATDWRGRCSTVFSTRATACTACTRCRRRRARR